MKVVTFLYIIKEIYNSTKEINMKKPNNMYKNSWDKDRLVKDKINLMSCY